MVINKEAYIRNRITRYGMFLRVLTFFAPGILTLFGGFRIEEFEELMMLLAPVSFFYLTVFIRFIITNRYQKKGKALTTMYVSSVYYILIAGYVMELLTVVFESFFTFLGAQLFFLIIMLFEIGFSIHAGYFLSQLFSNNTDNKEISIF